MILKFCSDNIFGLYPQAFVHPVNCVGLSHDAYSKQLKKMWPDYFREYTRLCLRNQLLAGESRFFSLQVLFGTKYIVTMPIKNHWQEKIQKQPVHEGLLSLARQCQELQITSLAIPKIDGLPSGWLESEIKNSFGKHSSHVVETCYLFRYSH